MSIDNQRFHEVILFNNNEFTDLIKEKVGIYGISKNISACYAVMLAAASFGKTKKGPLINAAIAAEFFYQALHHHYWQGKGEGADIILGDYYGSIAIIHASKTRDYLVLDTFCKAIQEATKNDDNANGAAGRLAKIYGASSYVGAYLAGLSGRVLNDFYKKGEQEGLKVLGVLGEPALH